MKALRLPALAVISAMCVLTATACGGSSHSSGAGTTTSSSTASTAPSQSPTQAKQEIKTTWEAFFGPNGSPSGIQGMNPQLEQTYTKSRSLLGKGSSATVSSVQLLSGSQCGSEGVPSPCAQVTYTVLLNGKPALPNAQGYATEQGGKWLVSKTTFCSLESLESSSTPAGC